MDSRVWSFIVFVLLVATFIWDPIIGTRALGLVEVVLGVYWLKIRRVPYGWEGRPPAGYLVGWPAVAAGALAIGIGVFFVAAPGVVVHFLMAPNNRWRVP